MAFQCNLSVIFALPAALVKILLKPDNLGVHNKPYKSYTPSLLRVQEVLFFAKKKYFFLLKKSTFFCLKKVLFFA